MVTDVSAMVIPLLRMISHLRLDETLEQVLVSVWLSVDRDPPFPIPRTTQRCRHWQPAGEKKTYTTTVGPLFSRSVARPRGHRAKKNHGVYHFPGKTREKGIHHRSGKKGIHHRASDPEREKKGGLHGGGVYFLLLWQRGMAIANANAGSIAFQQKFGSLGGPEPGCFKPGCLQFLRRRALLLGDPGIEGVKSPKIRGGVKILNFRGPLNLTLFYRDSIENPQFGSQKSKLSKDNFRGELPPPPLAFGTFWPPLSRSPICTFLHSFALFCDCTHFCVRLRLERPRLGTPEQYTCESQTSFHKTSAANVVIFSPK